MAQKTEKTFVVLKVFYMFASSNKKRKRIMEKNVILERAHKLMAIIGPQATTMDKVARECGISKRTLYEIFPDKKTLILEILEKTHREKHETFTRYFEESENNFEALLKIYFHEKNFFNEANWKFFDDIRRLYPQIHVGHEIKQIHQIQELAKIIETAKTQGLVIEKINSEIAVLLFYTTIKNINNNDLVSHFGYNNFQLIDGAFINFLRGIATIKGIECIETYLQKVKVNN